jgi:hypothetical protein
MGTLAPAVNRPERTEELLPNRGAITGRIASTTILPQADEF